MGQETISFQSFLWIGITLVIFKESGSIAVLKAKLNICSRCWDIHFESVSSFETQSFKPKNKKVINYLQTTWREPYSFFFLPLEDIISVKSPYKKKKGPKKGTN